METKRNRLQHSYWAFFVESRRWDVAGFRRFLHGRGSEGRGSLADLLWTVEKTQAKSATSGNKLDSFSNSRSSHLGIQVISF